MQTPSFALVRSLKQTLSIQRGLVFLLGFALIVAAFLASPKAKAASNPADDPFGEFIEDSAQETMPQLSADSVTESIENLSPEIATVIAPTSKQEDQTKNVELQRLGNERRLNKEALRLLERPLSSRDVLE